MLAGGPLVTCLVFVAGNSAMNRRNDCVPTRDPQVLKSRENQLRATAEKLLQAFRTGNKDAFLRLVHEQYFGMGEGKSYTLAELKETFRKKGDMYCYLLDSACIPPLRPPANGRELSFNEVAKRPEAKIAEVELWKVEGVEGCRGHVNYMWPTNPGERFDINVSRFTFVNKGGQWKTVGFDEPPIVDPER
jgi:hypothetical protein